MKWNHYSDGLQDYNLYKQFSSKITKTWDDAQEWKDHYSASSKNCGCNSSRSQFTISTKTLNITHSGPSHTVYDFPITVSYLLFCAEKIPAIVFLCALKGHKIIFS